MPDWVYLLALPIAILLGVFVPIPWEHAEDRISELERRVKELGSTK